MLGHWGAIHSVVSWCHRAFLYLLNANTVVHIYPQLDGQCQTLLPILFQYKCHNMPDALHYRPVQDNMNLYLWMYR